MLDDQVRHSTGLLVSKVDPQTVPQVQLEMRPRSVRGGGLRGLLIAQAIEAVEELEPTILELFCDEDHFILRRGRHRLGRQPVVGQPRGPRRRPPRP